MSTFAEWKKSSKSYKSFIKLFGKFACSKDAECLAQAAYKAGERQGRKDAEECAKSAIRLRALLNK